MVIKEHALYCSEDYIKLSDVNRILCEIDDDNSVMTVKKQYGRLAV